MDRTIQEAVQILSGTHLSDKVYALDATVVSVSELKRNCRVQAIGGKSANTFTARLMSAVDDGVLIVPAIGSTVCIIRSDFSVPYISQYSEVDKIIFRGGDLGGIIKVVELTEKLNNLVVELQAELVKIAAGIVVGGGTYTPGVIQDFDKTYYENLNVKHG